MALTDEQSQVAHSALSDLLTSEDKCAAIVGGAGTGKSFVASHLFNMLPAEFKVTYLTFTNKAAANLEKMLYQQGLGLQCDVSTIHRFLKLNKEHIDQQTGKRTFKKSNSNYHSDKPDPSTHLLVVDEMGTVPNNEDAPLAYELMQLDNPILCLGDDCQLPPPKEKLGVLFSLLEQNTYRLNQVVRYGGGLLESATYLRENIKSYDAIEVLNSSNNDGESGIFKLQPLALKKTIDQFVKSDEFLANPDYFRVLTWRKKTMDYWNAYIKKALYGNGALDQRFLIGERIIALESCNDKVEVRTDHKHFFKTVRLLSASQEGTVLDCSTVEEEIPCIETALYFYRVSVKTDRGDYVELRVIHENDSDKLDRILKKVASKRDWKTYWHLKDYFHDIKSAFSLNIDRCQGITIENALLDVGDIQACNDIWHRNRIAYTMLTRSKNKVFV